MKPTNQARTQLKFETKAGVKISNAFKTKKGNELQIIIIDNQTAAIREKSGNFTIHLSGPMDEVTTSANLADFAGGLIDTIKGALGSVVSTVLGALGGGSGGGGCTQGNVNATVNVNVSGGGTVNVGENGINVNIKCGDKPQ